MSETPSEGSYDYVGIIMSKSEEGDAIADAMREVDGVEVLENAAFWDIRAKDRLIIDYDEVSDFVGFEVDGSVIQREMSTTYGRQVVTDDQMMLFSDPMEAMEYLTG